MAKSSNESFKDVTLDYINAITENIFLELHGDRNVKDDKAMVEDLVKLIISICLSVSKKEEILKKESTETLEWPFLKVIEKH